MKHKRIVRVPTHQKNARHAEKCTHAIITQLLKITEYYIFSGDCYYERLQKRVMEVYKRRKEEDEEKRK